MHWGYPVNTPHPEEPPLKSAFHQSCDPVLPADATKAHDAVPKADKTPEELALEGAAPSSKAPDSPMGGSVAPSGLSRLSPTPSGSEEHYVEPKYLRPGLEDDDSLLVEPTHGRIKGFGSKPVPEVTVDDSRKGKKTVEHEETTIRLGDRCAAGCLHDLFFEVHFVELGLLDSREHAAWHSPSAAAPALH